MNLSFKRASGQRGHGLGCSVVSEGSDRRPPAQWSMRFGINSGTDESCRTKSARPGMRIELARNGPAAIRRI